MVDVMKGSLLGIWKGRIIMIIVTIVIIFHCGAGPWKGCCGVGVGL